MLLGRVTVRFLRLFAGDVISEGFGQKSDDNDGEVNSDVFKAAKVLDAKSSINKTVVLLTFISSTDLID